MASKVVELLLRAKNAISPGAKKATDSLSVLREETSKLERDLVKLDDAQLAMQGLEKTTQQAEEAERAFEQTQAELKRVKDALKTEKTPELAVALEKAKEESKAAKKEWQASSTALKKLERTITSVGGDLNDLAATQQKFSAGSKQLNSQVDNNRKRLQKLGGAMDEVADSTERSTVSVKGWVAGLAGAVAGLAIIDRIKDGMVSLAQSVFKTGTEFELLSKRLSADELAFIEKFARDTPLQLEGVSEAFALLRTYGIDPTKGSLQSLVDANAAMGGGQEKLEGIISAVGQAWSKQKLQQEEVLQLVERGIPAWDLLAEATGKSVPQLQDMATAGELGRKEIQLLIDAIGGANMGAAQKQMETMSGLVSNMQDRFTQFYRMIVDAGAWDYLKGQLQDVAAWFDEMASSGQLQKIAQQISDTFISAAESTKSFVAGLWEARGAITAMGQAWLVLKVATWAGQLRTAATGFTAVQGAAAGAATVVSRLGLLLKGGLYAGAALAVFKLVSAYRELKTEINKLEEAQAAEGESTAEVAKRFAEISNATGVTVKNMAQLNAAVDSGRIVIDKLTNEYLSAEEATHRFAERQQQAKTATESVTLSAGAMSERFKTVKQAIEQTIQSNEDLSGSFKEQLQQAAKSGAEGVGGFVIALRSLEQQGDLTKAQLQEGLMQALDQLSERQLEGLKTGALQAIQALDAGAESAGLELQYLQQLLSNIDTTSLNQSLSRLGIDLAQITGGISEGFKQSIDDLAALEQTLKSTSTTAADSGEAVYTALTNALKTAKTEADKIKFEEVLQRYQAEGEITYQQFQQLSSGLSDIATAAQTAGSEGVEGIRQLGGAAQEVSEKTAEAGRDVQGLAAGLSNWFMGVRGQLQSLSADAENAFLNKLGIDTQPVLNEIDSLKAGIESARETMAAIAADNLTVFDSTGINEWKNSVLQAKQETIVAYSEQKIKFLEYMDALKSGAGANESFINSAQNSVQWMELLGNEDLSTLRSALDSARKKLEAMNEQAESTLGSLKDELDRMNNNQDAIDERNYQRQRDELNQKLDEAQRYGNQQAIKQYQESLQVLEQIRREKKQSLQSSASGASAVSSSGTRVSGTATLGSQSRTTIELKGPSGSREIETDDKGAENLLGALQEWGVRTE